MPSLKNLWLKFRLLQLRGAVSWRAVTSGFEMELDPKDFMDQQFFLGTYAPDLDFIIRNWVSPGDTCIDIGAQKGFVTLTLASRVGSDGRVIAFEPDLRAREYLERNCAHNNVTHVQILEYAVGREEGIQSFHLSSQLGWSSAYPNAIADRTICSASEVPVRSLDGLISLGEINLDPNRLSLIKIDCEGAELFVLQGMKRLLNSTSPLLYIEINNSSLEAAQSSFEEILNVLRRSGYSAYLPVARWSIGGTTFVLQDIDSEGKEPKAVFFDIVALKSAAIERFRSQGLMIVKPRSV